jgi:hypothetical protein
MKSEVEIINLKLNGCYMLDLIGMGDAGYSWVYSMDKKNIVTISHQYIVPPNPKPGGTWIERFTIHGVQQGLCAIEFRQVQSWEKDRPPLSVRDFVVNVE